jgi:hypothetical protein
MLDACLGELMAEREPRLAGPDHRYIHGLCRDTHDERLLGAAPSSPGVDGVVMRHRQPGSNPGTVAPD